MDPGLLYGNSFIPIGENSDYPFVSYQELDSNKQFKVDDEYPEI